MQVMMAEGAGKISRRDYVIQPSVAATKEGLRWVIECKIESTPTRVEFLREETAMQPALGLKIILWDDDPG
jgi:hypothetical protein